MLKSTSEQSFGLKIGEEKCKLNQNICLKSRIINCGGFNMHLWFSVIIALRPKYIILSIFIPCRIEPSLLTLNQFMNGCFRKIKLPHPHQQFSEVLEERLEKRHFSWEVLCSISPPFQFTTVRLSPVCDSRSWPTSMSHFRRNCSKSAQNGTVRGADNVA